MLRFFIGRKYLQKIGFVLRGKLLSVFYGAECSIKNGFILRGERVFSFIGKIFYKE